MFPAPYRLRATEIKDVAIAATVSLIDPKLNKTVATALTNPDGEFVFGNLSPGPDPYILEAVKGLGGHLPGNPAVRVRTVIQFKSGVWTSMTGGLVTLNRATTAVAIVAGLRGLDAQNLIGKVRAIPNEPSVFDPSGTGATAEDYDQVLALVDRALLEDRDPVDAVLWTSARGYFLKEGGGARKVTILSILPLPMTTGGSVTIVGENIADFGFNNLVKIGEATASITSFGPSEILVLVPPGARSGELSVTNAVGTATATIRVIADVDGGFSPPSDGSGVRGATDSVEQFGLLPLIGGFGPEGYDKGLTDPGREIVRSEVPARDLEGFVSPPSLGSFNEGGPQTPLPDVLGSIDCGFSNFKDCPTPAP